MNKKSKYILISIIFLILFLFTYIFFIRDARENKLIKTGNEIVKKVEIYKQAKGSLPNSLSDLGIEEKDEGPLYYDKRANDQYIIWFGTYLGESKTYYSDSKQWEDYDR